MTKAVLAAVAAWVAACCFLRGSLAAPTEDLVDALPGFGAPVAPLYSGYLSPAPGQHVHYLLEESESEGKGAGGQRDPLILWLQGGPGASPLLGAFQEFGTYILNSDTSVVRNPFDRGLCNNVAEKMLPPEVGLLPDVQAIIRDEKVPLL